MSTHPLIDRLVELGASWQPTGEHGESPVISYATEAQLQQLVDEQVAIAKIVGNCAVARLIGTLCPKCDEKIAAISNTKKG